jgi:hypothetical protein
MKPLQHAKGTEVRHGGTWLDYIKVHSFIDSSKATFATTAHRALLHNQLGLELAVRIHGPVITNSDGVALDTRQIVIEHLEEDVGMVPTLDQWLAGIPEEKVRRVRLLPREIQALAGSNPAEGAAALFGGTPEDFQEAVAFFNICNGMSEDPRRDLFLHNSFGIWLAEQTIGPAITLNQGSGRQKLLSTREFGEHIVQARMSGFILSPHQIFSKTRIAPWMRGGDVARQARERRAAC